MADATLAVTATFAVPDPRRAASETFARGRWRTWALVLGLWTAFGVFGANETYAWWTLTDRAMASWPRVYAASLASAWLWAALTPAVAFLARLVPWYAPRWRRFALVHLAAGVTVAVVDAAAGRLVLALVSPYEPAPLSRAVLARLDSVLALYAAVVAVVHAADWHRRWRDRRLQAAALEAELARAQLEVLKMQLQPHFLFNVLQAIAELVHEDPGAADRMLTRLGRFLRLTLENVGTPEVALHRELDFLDAYLAVEQVRFGDRLTVHTRVDEAALDALVPSLVLQPLVENALRHGIARHDRAAVIEVAARRHADAVELAVTDNGDGLPAAGATPEGVGLRNTRQRLRGLYGDRGGLVLRDRTGGGVTAALRIPYRPAAVAHTRRGGPTRCAC